MEGEQCLDLEVCAEEMQAYDKNDIKWLVGAPSKTAAAAENLTKYGKNCAYDTETKAGRVLERMKLHDKKNSDVMCASRIKNCKTDSFVATCDFEDAIPLGDKVVISCPPPQDCLAKPVEATPAFTKSQAKALTANAGRPSASIVIAKSSGGSTGGSTSGGTSGGTTTGGSGTGTGKDDNHKK